MSLQDYQYEEIAAQIFGTRPAKITPQLRIAISNAFYEAAILAEFKNTPKKLGGEAWLDRADVSDWALKRVPKLSTNARNATAQRHHAAYQAALHER